MDKLQISGDTRISDLIKWNKDSIDAIASLSKPLKKLRNPILRKIMASRVTITEAAKMGGCELEDFERVLRPLGFMMASVAENREEREETPAWLENLPESAIHVFDVRAILDGGEDPLKEILKRFKLVPEKEALCIVNKFVPVPLVRLLEKDGVRTFTRTVGADDYHTYFYKSGDPAQDKGPSAEKSLPEKETNEPTGSEQRQSTDAGSDKIKMVSESEFDEIRARSTEITEMDVRALQMPGPMETILAILPELADGELLYVNHKRVPLYLL